MKRANPDPYGRRSPTQLDRARQAPELGELLERFRMELKRKIVLTDSENEREIERRYDAFIESLVQAKLVDYFAAITLESP